MHRNLTMENEMSGDGLEAETYSTAHIQYPPAAVVTIMDLHRRAEKAEKEVAIRDEMLWMTENNRQELRRRIDELEGKS